VLGDIVCTLGASLVVRGILDAAESAGSNHWLDFLLHGMAMALVVVIAFYYSDLYAIDQTLSVQELMHRFVAGLGAACIVIGVISYPIPNFGKSIYVSEMLMMGIALGIWRFGFMRVIKQAAIRANVLIIGIRGIGKLIAEELYLKRKLGMEVIGFVGTEAGLVTLSYGNPRKVELPIFAPPSLASLVVSRRVGRILLSGTDDCSQSYFRELVTVRAMGVPIEDCHSFYERLVSKIAITDLPPEWIALSEGFRRDRIVLAAKRVIDVIVAFLGLLLGTPLALMTALAIKLESPGPIFYRQERVGQNEKHFTLLKFRSMTQDAEATVGPVWATENDPRLTRVGAIIRKLRIDEIPQMINVLKGEMSFVGPRPERSSCARSHRARSGSGSWARSCPSQRPTRSTRSPRPGSQITWSFGLIDSPRTHFLRGRSTTTYESVDPTSISSTRSM